MNKIKLLISFDLSKKRTRLRTARNEYYIKKKKIN